MIKDADFLADVLADGEWHSLGEILERSVRDRGCGLTVHSRVSDLRKRGFVIENRTAANGSGRRDSSYRLISSGVPAGGGIVAGGEPISPPPVHSEPFLGPAALPPLPGGSPFDGLECIATSAGPVEPGAAPAVAAPEPLTLDLGAV